MAQINGGVTAIHIAVPYCSYMLDFPVKDWSSLVSVIPIQIPLAQPNSFLETCHSFTASQTIYSDTVTHWMTEQPNSYPLSTTVLLETLVTLTVHVSHSAIVSFILCHHAEPYK